MKKTERMQEFLDLPGLPEEHVPMTCLRCNTKMKSVDYTLADYDDMNCVECGHEGSIYDWDLGVYPQAMELMDNRLCRTMTFYHATSIPEWYDGLPADVLVHVGSHRSALERAFAGGASFMYRVRIKPRMRFDEDLMWDRHDGDMPTRVSKERGFDLTLDRDVVYRYVNRYEGPGHISLMLTKNKFEVLGMRRISFEKLPK